jgi:predicted permease
VLILALGIGVTAAVFSLLRTILWQPLPVARPHELQRVVNPKGEPFLFNYPTVRRLAENSGAARVVAFSNATTVAFRAGETPAERFSVQFVHGSFFPALQIAPAAGRLLNPADDDLARPHAVAVLSWHCWKRRFNSDPGILGSPVRLNGHEITIVGVAPESFTGVSLGEGIEAWLPAGLHAALRANPSAMTISDSGPVPPADWTRDERAFWLNLLLRVPAGTEGAAEELEAAWRPQLQAAQAILTDPETRAEWARNSPRLQPGSQGFSDLRDDFRRTGLTLALLVGAVVLVAAANTATLLLLRMLSRGREMGVRQALGAGRWRLVRGALLEGLVLSLLGAAGGLVIGLGLTPLLATWLAPGAVDALPGLDLALVCALAGLAVLLGLALGAAPAWVISRLAPQSVLQQRGPFSGGSVRLGRVLIVLQLALSVVLIAVAGALALDLRRLLNAPLGYARESVLATFFNFDAAGIASGQQPAVMARLRAAAESSPQVKAAGFAASGALSGSRSHSGTYFRGAGVNQPKNSQIQHETIDEHYFNAMGMALVRGRNFAATDKEGGPRVAIITQRLAREVFGDADPVGRRFGFDRNASDNDWEIVGVAPDARVNGVRDDPPAMYYLPLGQWAAPAGCFVIRVEGDPAAARETLRRAVSAAEPTLVFTPWRTFAERAQRWLHNDIAAARLTAGFGLLATLLAAIGVLGTLGYLVASRSRDIAVRLAIGAEPNRVWRGIVREALLLGGLGSAIGLVLALLLPRALGSWMMAGLRTDAMAVAMAAGTGLLAAFIGGLLPARRAAKVDPLTLLKAE